MPALETLARLRRLAESEPGPGVLRLPSDLPSRAALEAVRAALALLEKPAPPRPTAPRPVRTGGAAIRVHIDGAARGNPGPAGLGVAFFGPDGTVLEGLARFIGEATNNVAEYRALLLALERAEELGCAELAVYSDSELLVRQIQGRYRVKHPALQPLFAEAKQRMARFRRVEVHHVRREENREADALANRGIDQAARSGAGGAPGTEEGVRP
ncbi:MAG: ribonuclease HI family protein [Candidatus Methylomirabilota bacterium]